MLCEALCRDVRENLLFILDPAVGVMLLASAMVSNALGFGPVACSLAVPGLLICTRVRKALIVG